MIKTLFDLHAITWCRKLNARPEMRVHQSCAERNQLTGDAHNCIAAAAAAAAASTTYVSYS